MSAEILIDQKTYDDLVASVGSDFIGELLAAYLEETPMLLAELRDAWERRDAGVFQRAAHSIKSSSASLGALPLADLARTLEMRGKQNELDEAGDELDALLSGYARTERAFRERMA